MVDAQTNASILMALVPVVVGGIIGVAGSWLGPLFLEARKQEADKKRTKADKCEELVGGLYEYEHWVDLVRDTYLYSSANEILPPLPISPLAKVHAIAALYFPDLRNSVAGLELAGRTYQSG